MIITRKALKAIGFIPYIPHYILYKICSSNKTLTDELRRWSIVLGIKGNTTHQFFWLISHLSEYRSLFYHRVNNPIIHILKIYSPGQSGLFIRVPSERIKCGLVLQHAHSTEILCKSIGYNCQIWQNVTIGKKTSGGSIPTIGNNVKICTGAVILGDVKVGDNTIIGANTVVIKNIPDNCTVVGNPARIVKINEVLINEPL